MIYRILLQFPPDKDFPGITRDTIALYGPEMTDLGCKPPKTKKFSPRARFYFTEDGWDQCGRELYKMAKRDGYNPIVIRRKSPKRSEVAYWDQHQVALHPASKGKK